ncbi:MAG: hypothetical protein E5Y63_32620 [Mesorhizobium sp.]|nr:MAG: hypothetical protein E5Y63_32620 [Mesorhizobium sp.]
MPRWQPISPLSEEMSGRTEGGVKDRRLCFFLPAMRRTLRSEIDRVVRVKFCEKSDGRSSHAFDQQAGGTAPPSALPGISLWQLRRRHPIRQAPIVRQKPHGSPETTHAPSTTEKPSNCGWPR